MYRTYCFSLPARKDSEWMAFKGVIPCDLRIFKKKEKQTNDYL